MDFYLYGFIIFIATIAVVGSFIYFCGFVIAQKNKIKFDLQEKEDEIKRLETSYAEDLQNLQKLNDQLSYQNGVQTELITALKHQLNQIKELSAEHFKPVFDDLNGEGGLDKFQTKRAVRDHIFTQIKTFVNDIKSIN